MDCAVPHELPLQENIDVKRLSVPRSSYQSSYGLASSRPERTHVRDRGLVQAAELGVWYTKNQPLMRGFGARSLLDAQG